MEPLDVRDRELVALGAAMGSNCVPCIEYHIPQARSAGLSDAQIGEAIRLADKVRQVPAAKVLKAALTLLQPPDATPATESPEAKPAEAAQPCCV